MKVFASAGNYLLKFGASKMNYPRGLAISEDRILICQGNHCILNYKLNGEFISKIGRQGLGELEFNNPLSLTMDELNGDIYVSECGNNRIQVLYKDFSFKSKFGKNSLKAPVLDKCGGLVAIATKIYQ